MAVTAADVARRLAQLLPQGPIWPDPDDMQPGWAGLLEGLGGEAARVYQSAADALREAWPGTASQTLDRWEALLGLPSTGTEAERQAAAAAALLARGWAAEPDLLAVASVFGETNAAWGRAQGPLVAGGDRRLHEGCRRGVELGRLYQYGHAGPLGATAAGAGMYVGAGAPLAPALPRAQVAADGEAAVRVVSTGGASGTVTRDASALGAVLGDTIRLGLHVHIGTSGGPQIVTLSCADSSDPGVSITLPDSAGWVHLGGTFALDLGASPALDLTWTAAGSTWAGSTTPLVFVFGGRAHVVNAGLETAVTRLLPGTRQPWLEFRPVGDTEYQ